MPNISDLPTELIDLILSNLDNRSLLNIYNLTSNYSIYRIIDKRLQLYVINYNDIIKTNNKDLIMLLMNYTISYDRLLAYAAKNNHREMVDYIIGNISNSRNIISNTWCWSMAMK